MTRLDQNFNPLSRRFKRNIYQTAKGRIRLSVLKHILTPIVTQSVRLRVLDCGAGLGQMSLWFAAHGHEVHAIDIADDLLAEIQQQASDQGLSQRIVTEQTSLQALAARDLAPRYDLVLCHAVIEWLQTPEAAIAELAQLIAPEGRLSLMFYNKEALVINNLLRGNFYQAVAPHQGGEAGGLTPINPIERPALAQWLAGSALHSEQWTGLRSFYDYLPSPIKQARSEADITELELQLCQREPYISMARYIHVLARPNNRTPHQHTS